MSDTNDLSVYPTPVLITFLSNETRRSEILRLEAELHNRARQGDGDAAAWSHYEN